MGLKYLDLGFFDLESGSPVGRLNLELENLPCVRIFPVLDILGFSSRQTGILLSQQGHFLNDGLFGVIYSYDIRSACIPRGVPAYLMFSRRKSASICQSGDMLTHDGIHRNAYR